MKIVIDARSLDKISKTLLSVDRLGMIEYLGEGAEDGIRVSTSSPKESFCAISVKRGWTESVQMEGDPGEQVVVDLTDVKSTLQEIKGGKSDLITLESSEDCVTLSAGTFSRVVEKKSVKVEKQIPTTSAGTVKFRISGSKIKRILNEIKNTDDTVTISLGDYSIIAKIGREEQKMEGYGACFWTTETDELFVSNEPLSLAARVPGGDFSTRYFVEPLADTVSEARVAREEKMEVQFGPGTPIALKFRLAESVFVDYIQAAKKSGTDLLAQTI